MKISILAFDLSDNATGRAELLARLLACRWHVEIVGPRFGDGVWRPAADSPIAHRALAVGGAARYPAFRRHLRPLAALADGDVLYASKPRATSFGIALRARRERPRPLLLDVDDWEVGFFRRSGGWGTLGRALNVGNPNGLPWTWLMERRIGRADAVTVASRFLAKRFGGTLIPHVRDTEAWDPARFDRAAGRAALGLGRERVVMFLGTPRGHKGVDDLVEAVGAVGGDTRLVLVGADAASAGGRRWAAQPWVRLIGEVPFDDVPRYLAAADAVAIPQRATSDTLGQVPAKLFDAMAMARPIVSTAVSMIPEILDGCGVLVPPGDVVALAASLKRVLDDPETSAELGRRARERCRERYSFTAARAALFPVVERAIAGARR
ncbi:MAG TPA: glycosyltransferase family 4 protein [Methylomirabilota bacterium]|nr:glycosyltransferase family 4 protein [Methylomirabilota bacterium]